MSRNNTNPYLHSNTRVNCNLNNRKYKNTPMISAGLPLSYGQYWGVLETVQNVLQKSFNKNPNMWKRILEDDSLSSSDFDFDEVNDNVKFNVRRILNFDHYSYKDITNSVNVPEYVIKYYDKPLFSFTITQDIKVSSLNFALQTYAETKNEDKILQLYSGYFPLIADMVFQHVSPKESNIMRYLETYRKRYLPNTDKYLEKLFDKKKKNKETISDRDIKEHQVKNIIPHFILANLDPTRIKIEILFCRNILNNARKDNKLNDFIDSIEHDLQYEILRWLQTYHVTYALQNRLIEIQYQVKNLLPDVQKFNQLSDEQFKVLNDKDNFYDYSVNNIIQPNYNLDTTPTVLKNMDKVLKQVVTKYRRTRKYFNDQLKPHQMKILYENMIKQMGREQRQYQNQNQNQK